jgi:pimeloyl-ACP methyl ester carboxylesterase
MSWFEYGPSRIYYEELGRGESVLLLPGFAMGGNAVAGVRAALAEKYRVIAADLPGSGHSQPQPRAYAASYLEEDAHAFAAMLRELQVAPARLVGFSDGGDVSLLIAAIAPDVARCVAVWGAAGFLSDPSGHLQAVMANVVDDPPPPLQGFSDYLKEFYGVENARVMTRNLVAAVGAIIKERGGDVSLSRASDIACAVLLIAGEHDIFAPSSLAAQYAARAPKGEWLEAKNAGHDVHNARPEWLADTLLAWLGKH